MSGVLCQQPLQSIAAERLQRFHQFVHNDVATRANDAEHAFKGAVEELGAFEIVDEETTAAINSLASDDKDFAESLTSTLESAKRAKDRIVERLNGRTREQWVELPRGRQRPPSACKRPEDKS